MCRRYFTEDLQLKMTTTASSRWLAVILTVITPWIWYGCSRPAKDITSDEFFTNWLQAHGESNIVADAYGVGLASNPTRLRWALYGSEQPTNGTFNAELEFRVRVPDQREIVEFVAGTGSSQQQAEDDAKANFVVSTFHVIYRSFLNPQDSHQTEEKITVAGQARVLVLGDTMTRGQTTNNGPNLFPFRDRFREMLAAQPLSPQVHWLKIIYANHRSKMMMCAVTLDNEDSPVLTEAVSKLEWPKPEEFYMVKQFIVVK